jgi:redox-sensitive bicupin YhaK (pirin superfamily)
MGNNKMIVDERQRDIGNFHVGRLLPFRKKRSVGPFVFIDHMGPTTIQEGKYMDVDQHPHIGLSTLTYLLEGEIEHRDSVGSVQVVRTGDVGFMTAGKAVTHTERSPQHHRDGNIRNMHGYQIWVALPKDKEDMDARFDFYTSDQIPQWEENGLKIRLPAGEAFGKKSPLSGYSPLFLIDILAKHDSNLDLRDKLCGELAIVVVHGSINEDGEEIHQGQMMISKTNEVCSLDLKKGTRVLLFGGEAFPEERFLLWNFASSSKEKLQEAKQLWKEKGFPVVPGDDTYIPFP